MKKYSIVGMMFVILFGISLFSGAAVVQSQTAIEPIAPSAFRIVVRHYTKDITIKNITDDITKVQKATYDNTSRTGSIDHSYYPYITSTSYNKNVFSSGCWYSGKKIDDITEGSFPGNVTKTCPEPATHKAQIPYTSFRQRKGGATTKYKVLYEDTEYEETAQEDSRADLIIEGGDPEANYITSIPVMAIGIYPASQYPDEDWVDGWVTKYVECNKFDPAPGTSLEWSHNDPFLCHLRYVVRGNSITDVTPLVNVPYYNYGFAGASYYGEDGISIVPAGPTPIITSGRVSMVNSPMLASILAVSTDKNVIYNGTNIPTDGTAVVLLSGNNDMWKVTPAVDGNQFSFAVPSNLAAGTYFVRIRGGNTVPSNSASLDILANGSISTVVPELPISTTTSSTSKLSLSPVRQTIESGEKATLNFTVPSNTLRSQFKLNCPQGLAVLSDTGTNQCGIWQNWKSTTTQYSAKFINYTQEVKKAVPNFYIYTKDRPTFAQGVSGEITVNVPKVTSPVYKPNTAASLFIRNQTIGSMGAEVEKLQTFLESKGYLVMPQGVAKGYFGKATMAALARYQASVGISPANGYFGPATREIVNKIMTTGVETSATVFPLSAVKPVTTYTPTPITTVTPKVSATPTYTPSTTITPRVTTYPTVSRTPSPTSTYTPATAASSTPTPSASPSASVSPSASPSSTVTTTPSPSSTVSETPAVTSSPTTFDSPSASVTPVATTSSSPSASPTGSSAPEARAKINTASAEKATGFFSAIKSWFLR